MTYLFDLQDRVRDYCTVTGYNSAQLYSEPPPGFQGFSVFANGYSTYYTIVDSVTNQWEVGIGTYNSTANTLSRDEVLSSSDGGNPILFVTPTRTHAQEIFVTYPASVALASNNPARFVGFFITYSPDANETVALYSCTEFFQFPENFAGWAATCQTYPNADVTLNIALNGVPIGYVIIYATGTINVVQIGTGAIQCAPGDQLQFYADENASVADGMQNFSLTLKGSLY